MDAGRSIARSPAHSLAFKPPPSYTLATFLVESIRVPSVAARARAVIEAVRHSGLSIYDPIDPGNPALWFSNEELQYALATNLVGRTLGLLPARTRSKRANEWICEALGYSTPRSFDRTVPRFPGQDFDKYVQASNNLQIWNQEIAPTRRYVVVGVTDVGVVHAVRVLTGVQLAEFDTTGTLTKKYQARGVPAAAGVELVSQVDTDLLRPHVRDGADLRSKVASADAELGLILSVNALAAKLQSTIGQRIRFEHHAGRSGGDALHHLVARALGYGVVRDDGQFPDIRHQLLEVKLQTAPTIDLGLVDPASSEAFGHPAIGASQVRPSDVRYAVYFGQVSNGQAELRSVVLSTGERFFDRFTRFGGRGVNTKLQLHLPGDFFAP